MAALTGKVAAVTGASSGTGRAIATRFAAEGADVYLLARDEVRLKGLADELGPTAVPLPTDVTDAGEVAASFERIHDEHGRLDILINNAGIYRPCRVEHLSDEDINRQIATNFVGPVHTCRAAVPLLRAAGGGDIVNTSSESTMHPFPMLSMYVATKAALEAFGDVLAQEVRDDDIRVTTLVQGTATGPGGGTSDWAWDPVHMEEALKVWTDAGLMAGAYGRHGGQDVDAVADVHLYIVTRTALPAPRPRPLPKLLTEKGTAMPGIEPFRYDGKHVLVVGGATGMGAAAAAITHALGAVVTVLDHAQVDDPAYTSVQVDLRDPGDIDAALKQVDGPVDSVINAAGVADGTPGIMRVNFIGHRHIVEQLVDDGRLGHGGAICMISSVAGLGWEGQIPTLVDFLETPDYAAAAAWVDSHDGTDNYIFSKQAMNCYVARRSFPLMSKGIRINAICPGPTDTPLARANADMWLGFAQDYRDATGTGHLTPEQMGNILAFLNSDAAAGISGVNLLVDNGYLLSSLSGAYEPGNELAKLILGRA